MKVTKLGVIAYDVPQDLECKFCGTKGLTGTAVVIASASQLVVCASCIMTFADAIEQSMDMMIAGIEGATFH